MESTPVSSDAGPTARISAGADAKRFMLAGNAYVTLVSQKTGTRFTYRIQLADARPGDTRQPPHFVAVLTGPNNGNDYQFIGTIFEGNVFRIGRKLQHQARKPSVAAFDWAWNSHISRGEEPPQCEIWHAGRCGKCGRKLTTPESIALGLGPVCAAGGSDG